MAEAKDTEKVRQIVAHVYGHNLVGAPRPVGQGLVNQVYGVHLEGRELVVRFCDGLDMALEHQKEAWCIQQAALVGVPGSTVLAVGTLGDTSYMLQTFLEGTKGENASSEWPHIWHELGRYARLIHSIRVSGYGGLLIDAAKGIFSNPHTPAWVDFVDYNIASLTADDPLLRLGVYSASQRHEVATVFEAVRNQPFRFGLCHCDLKPRNTVLNAVGRVSLLDWGSAVVHIVPHIDLAEILRWQDPAGENVRALLDGYGLSYTEFEAILPQVEALQLVGAFDLVRWAIDRRPDRLEGCAARAKDLLARYLHGKPWQVDQEKWASEQVTP